MTAKVISRAAAVCGVFGLSQISLVSSQNANFTFRIEKWRVIYSSCLMCLLVLLIPVQIYYYQPEGDLADNIGMVYWTVMNPFGIFLAISSSLFHRKEIFNTVNTLCVCQNTLTDLTRRPTFVPAVKYAVLFAILWCAMGVADFKAAWDSLIQAITEYLAMIYLYFIILQFAIYVLVIGSFLRDLDIGMSDYFENEAQEEKEFCGVARLVIITPKVEDGQDGQDGLPNQSSEQRDRQVRSPIQVRERHIDFLLKY